MVFLSRNSKAVGKRECFWIFELPQTKSAGETPTCPTGKTPVLPSSLRFQRDVTAAALAIDAQQNFFVSLQFLADDDQILRVLNRLSPTPLETGPQAVPPSVVRRISPCSPTATPALASKKYTPCKVVVVPDTSGAHVAPASVVFRIVPLSPTTKPIPESRITRHLGCSLSLNQQGSIGQKR
jgi:hypothetical protein